jgi:hypothetical protein
MAFTNPGNAESTAGVKSAIDDLLFAFTVRTLFANLELANLGTRGVVPGGTGINLYKPFYDQAVAEADAVVAGTAATVNELTHDAYEGKIKFFERVIGFEDTYMAQQGLGMEDTFEALARVTHALALWIENEILTNHGSAASANMDEGIQDEGAGSGVAVQWVGPAGTDVSDYGNITDGDGMTPRGLAACRKLHTRNSCPGLPQFGGRYAFWASPDAVFDLTTVATANIMTLEESSMAYQDAFKDGVIGAMHKHAIIESSNVPAINETHGMTGGGLGSGYLNMSFGLDAFFVSPLASMMPQVIRKPFGSGSALNDATDRFASIGAKAGFGAFHGDKLKRMIHVPSSDVVS